MKPDSTVSPLDLQGEVVLEGSCLKQCFSTVKMNVASRHQEYSRRATGENCKWDAKARVKANPCLVNSDEELGEEGETLGSRRNQIRKRALLGNRLKNSCLGAREIILWVKCLPCTNLGSIPSISCCPSSTARSNSQGALPNNRNIGIKPCEYNQMAIIN